RECKPACHRVIFLLVLLFYCRRTFLLWFGGIFALAGLILFAVTIFVVIKTGHRREGYYSVTATTTGKHRFSHVSGGDSYDIDYRYTDRSGQAHKASANASKSQYDRAANGRPLDVFVSIQDSSDSWPEEEGSPNYTLAAITGGTGALFFVPGAIL